MRQIMDAPKAGRVVLARSNGHGGLVSIGEALAAKGQEMYPTRDTLPKWEPEQPSKEPEKVQDIPEPEPEPEPVRDAVQQPEKRKPGRPRKRQDAEKPTRAVFAEMTPELERVVKSIARIEDALAALEEEKASIDESKEKATAELHRLIDGACVRWGDQVYQVVTRGGSRFLCNVTKRVSKRKGE